MLSTNPHQILTISKLNLCYFDGPDSGIDCDVEETRDAPRCRGQRNQDTKTKNAETEKPKAFAAAAGR